MLRELVASRKFSWTKLSILNSESILIGELAVAKREEHTGYRITNQSWRELRLASTRNRYKSDPESGLGGRWRGHKVRLGCTNDVSTS